MNGPAQCVASEWKINGLNLGSTLEGNGDVGRGGEERRRKREEEGGGGRVEKRKESRRLK